MTRVAEKALEAGKQPRPKWLWIVFLLASLVYAVPAIWMLTSYMQLPYDLGIYDQALWLIAHGETLITIAGISVNSAHFSPILYLISPIAYVPGGASPELILQSVLLASGVFPAAKLGQFLNQDGRWFSLAYAIHPAIIGGSWYGWRPWNMAVPVLMWLVYWIMVEPSWIRLTSAGLIMLTFREDLAVWIGVLALVLALAKKITWQEVIKSALILAPATVLVVFVVLPAGGLVDGYYFVSSNQVLGGSPSVLLSSGISRVIFLLAPLAILPRRFNWLLLIPFSFPLIGLLIRGGNSLSTFFHYDMMFVPVLLVVVALSASVSYRPMHLVVASLLVLLGLGALRPFPPRAGGNPLEYNSEVVAALDEVRTVVDALEMSATASMSLPDLLVPHYSERSNIFVYPHPADVQRDERAKEPAISIHFDCPEPNFVVASPGSLSPSWHHTLEDGYTRTDFTLSRLVLWTREDLAPDDPCSASYTESTSPE